jgi:hypothetical protein
LHSTLVYVEKLDIHAGANPSLSQIGVKIVHDPTQLSEPVFTSVEPGSYTMSTIVEPPITTTYSARVGMIRGTFIWFWKAGLENMNYLDAVGATFTDDAGVTITITNLKSDSQQTGSHPAVLYVVDQPPFQLGVTGVDQPQWPIVTYFDIDIETVSTTVTGVEITANLTTPITTPVLLGNVTYTSTSSSELPFDATVIDINNKPVDIPIANFGIVALYVHFDAGTITSDDYDPITNHILSVKNQVTDEQFTIIDNPTIVDTGMYCRNGHVSYQLPDSINNLYPTDIDISCITVCTLSSLDGILTDEQYIDIDNTVFQIRNTLADVNVVPSQNVFAGGTLGGFWSFGVNAGRESQDVWLNPNYDLLHEIRLDERFIAYFQYKYTASTDTHTRFIKVYTIDGGLEYTETAMHNAPYYFDGGDIVRIGSIGQSSFIVYEVMLYKRALTETEISEAVTRLSEKWNVVPDNLVFNVHVTPPTNPPFTPRESRFYGMWGYFPISRQFNIDDIVEVPIYINTGNYVLSGFAFNAYYASQILEPIDFEFAARFSGSVNSHAVHDANDAYQMKYMVVSIVTWTSFTGRNIYAGKVRFRVKTDDYAEYLRLTDSPGSIGNAGLVEDNRFPIFKLHVTSLMNEMSYVFESDRVGYLVDTDNEVPYNEYHAYFEQHMHSYGYFINPVLNP